MRPFGPRLLHCAPPGGPRFALVANGAGDTRFVPYVAEHGWWEPAETLFLLRTLRPGMHAVDVGAHVGYYSVLLSQVVGPRGSVVSCEPEPENLRLLRANCHLNGCANVAVRGLAVADRVGAATLALSADNLGDHRLRAVGGRATVEVECSSLDAILDGRGVDLLKIDTQGSEPRVFAGAEATIEANRGRLACIAEFAPGLLAEARGEREYRPAIAAFAGQLDALAARVYAIDFAAPAVRLTPLPNLTDGLHRLAASLPAHEQDASTDLLLFFDPVAEADWLARFTG